MEATVTMQKQRTLLSAYSTSTEFVLFYSCLSGQLAKRVRIYFIMPSCFIWGLLLLKHFLDTINGDHSLLGILLYSTILYLQFLALISIERISSNQIIV